MRPVWVVGGVCLLMAASLTIARPAPAQPAPPPTSAEPALTIRERIPPDLVGIWERRDAYLIVSSTGMARFRWRTVWCEADVAQPCDRRVGDAVQMGAHADIGLSGPDPEGPSDTLVGMIVNITPTDLFVVGPMSIVRVSQDLIEVRQSSQRIELCRPPRELNFCGALLNNPGRNRSSS